MYLGTILGNLFSKPVLLKMMQWNCSCTLSCLAWWRSYNGNNKPKKVGACRHLTHCVCIANRFRIIRPSKCCPSPNHPTLSLLSFSTQLWRSSRGIDHSNPMGFFFNQYPRTQLWSLCCRWVNKYVFIYKFFSALN